MSNNSVQQAYSISFWVCFATIYNHSFHCFVWQYWGFELRDSYLLAWCSITWTIPPALFDLVIIFKLDRHSYSQTSLDCDSPIYIFT
jgi:hypothetical protein